MRSRFQYTLALLLAIVLTLSVALAAPTDYDINHPEALTADQLYGQSCLVMDADTGVVLFEKDADARRYPASTTKIVTCILAIEWAQENGMLGKEVTIPIGSYVNSEESRMELTEGDRMTFEDLLYGMMIKSGNDAANAAAIIIAGSTGEFVKLMNSFVESLGISPASTHFTNVTGMHDVNHFTTARDLATIMAYCLQNDIFRQMIACTEYTVYSAYWPNGKTFETKYDLIDSTKALYYPFCIGGKTGYTKAAGRSFIGAAVKDDITLIAVSLNPPDANNDPKDYFEAFTDNIRLFKYGFLQYETLSFKDFLSVVCETGFRSVQVERPIKDDEYGGLLEWTVTDIPGDYSESYLKRDLEDEESRQEIRGNFENRLSVTYLNGTVKAPVEKGQIIGKATFKGRNDEIYEGNIVALREVKMEPYTSEELFNQEADKFPKLVQYLMPSRYPIAWVLYIVLAVAILAVIVFVSAQRAKRNKVRRAALEARRREYLRRMQREEYLRKHPEAAQRKSRSGGRK